MASWTCFLVHQLIQNQEVQAENRPDETLVLTEVKNLQAELQNTLTALQQQEPSDLLDEEKVNIMLTVKFTWVKSCPKLSDYGDADIIRYSEDMNDDVFCILSAELNMHT